MNKEYYTFEELDDIELQLIEIMGVDELYTAMSKWLGYEKLEQFLKDFCRDHDIELDQEVEENEE